MVNNFNIARIPAIHFGPGVLQKLPDLLRPYHSKVLFLVSQSLYGKIQGFDKIEGKLKEQNLNYIIITVHGEPLFSKINELKSELKDQELSAVVAIGGGSTIDTGKAISAMMMEPLPVENYLEDIGKSVPSGKKIPFIAIPATAGTGSEATKNAVISNTGPSGYKRSLRHENYVPDIAIVDPELSLSCSADVSAASGMDALTQLIESFLSTNSNSFTDALALKGLEAARDSLPLLASEPNNLDARCKMSFAALNSGICLANAGLGLVHGFASSVGGMLDIPHGTICGSLLAEVNYQNIKMLESAGNPDLTLKKYFQLANCLLPSSNSEGKDLLAELSDLLFEWTNLLSIPGLGRYGLREEQLDKIVETTDLKYNPVKLSKEMLRIILKKSI